MTAETLTVQSVLKPDDLARAVSNQWIQWSQARQSRVAEWEDVRRYVYATDTTTTDNASLPWKNKTTFPKLTQIMDNLVANYVKSLFPKRQWLIWEGFDQSSEDKAKKDAIQNYMNNAVEQSGFRTEIDKMITDWVLTGNCFGTVEWYDGRVQVGDLQKAGYVGPRAVRIDPLNIVFNPIAESFERTPKIIRKWVTLGDLKSEISRLSPSDDHAQELWDYLIELRSGSGGTNASTAPASDVGQLDTYLQVDGFSDFRSYLGSDYAEVLTFYGDLLVKESGEFHQNSIITVVDRHRVIAVEPNPSTFGFAPIFHSAWRERADNLYGMGPLDNLVGMQYRIDHLENLKADVMDLNAYPVLKVKGYVEDFKWGPMERIYVDQDSDVDMVTPHWEIMNANMEINELQQKMEEIAGAPKEAMGIRTPGEKTAYEVQRLESAAGRIFQVKLEHFETFEESLLTGMLELARRRLTSQEFRIFDDELKVAVFQTLTANDITGNGRLRPVAAKHFAERAERVQNVTSFFSSPVGQDQSVRVHFSGLEIAKMFEDLLDLQGYHLLTPFVQISEMQEAQQLQQSAQEQTQVAQGTPGGLTPDDVSPQTIQELRQAAQARVSGNQGGQG